MTVTEMKKDEHFEWQRQPEPHLKKKGMSLHLWLMRENKKVTVERWLCLGI